MLDTTQTVEANAETAGQGDASVSNGSASQASQSDAIEQAGGKESSLSELDVLNKIMGRSFLSLEDAKKHYDSLNSFVGDQAVAALREDAKLTQGLIKQIVRENPTWTESDAKRYLSSLHSQANPQATQAVSSYDPKQAALEEKLQAQEREVFTLKNPDATPYLSKIEEYARATGKTLHESYQLLYGDVVKETRDKIQAESIRLEKKGAQVNASGSSPQTPSLVNQSDKLMEQYRQTGNDEFLKEAVKLRNSNRFWKKEQ